MNTKTADKIFNCFNALFMLAILAVTLYPIIYVLSISLSSAEFVKANEITFYPKGLNLAAYTQVFNNQHFWNAYKNTIIYTVLGTAISLSFSTMLAFCLSRRELVFRRSITFLVVLTMFFSGGMVPDFLLIRWLGLYNTVWALVLPTAISTYNMIIIRTNMLAIPDELFESASIEGANDLRLFAQIAVPLSKASLATVGLFYAVAQWNSYFAPMIYLKSKSLFPLQIILKEMIMEQNMQGAGAEVMEMLKTQTATSEMIICSSIIIALIPILLVYPYIQRFFIKGVMIGAVKG